MNLSNLEKDIFKKVAYVIGIILVIGLLWFGTVKVIDYFQDKKVKRQYELIDKYKYQIDSITKENTLLITRIEVLENEVDSLVDVKSKIETRYEVKINTIYDATPVDNAKWLDAVLKQLKSNSN